MNAPPRHILTVNLEDYFQVGAFNKFIQKNRWQRFESRVEVTTDRTLELLAKHGATATFFVLGWVAEQFPEVVKRVADAGHEVGVRGYYHRGVRDMTPDEFRADVVRARTAVEGATGRRALGFRLADGWFGPDDLWALDVLADLGFAYDSSIAPMRGTFGDDPRRLTPHEHQAGGHSILELPVSTGAVLGMQVPVAGGNYLRQLPRWFTRRAAERWVANHPHPLVAYFHTWELDADQPELSGIGFFRRMRHYRNLSRMPARIGELLVSFPFGSAADYLGLSPEPVPPRTAFAPMALNETDTQRLAHTPTGSLLPVSVVVPCYNEELLIAHLKNTLEEVDEKLGRRYEVEFVIVDDASTDDTWNRLSTTFADCPKVRLVRHDVNQGVAAAILSGIRAAHAEVVCSIDSDCSYDPLKLGEMIPLLTPGIDLVTASPYHPGGGVKNVPEWRLGLSKGCAWLYRRILNTKLHTYTSCFRVYRRSTVAAIPLKNGRFLGVAELIGRLDLAGKKVIEFPAVLETRLLGRSKLKTFRTILGHMKLMLDLSIDRWRQDNSADRDQVIRGQLSHLKKSLEPSRDPDPPTPIPLTPA
ncbi:MAG: DUF3473 domain-containing protein [Fimbriiglobus sp.]|nr:DUF3473 domain-containing protein [Fimbriiglobus sp.]